MEKEQKALKTLQIEIERCTKDESNSLSLSRFTCRLVDTFAATTAGYKWRN